MYLPVFQLFTFSIYQFFLQRFLTAAAYLLRVITSRCLQFNYNTKQKNLQCLSSAHRNKCICGDCNSGEVRAIVFCKFLSCNLIKFIPCFSWPQKHFCPNFIFSSIAEIKIPECRSKPISFNKSRSNNTSISTFVSCVISFYNFSLLFQSQVTECDMLPLSGSGRIFLLKLHNYISGFCCASCFV